MSVRIRETDLIAPNTNRWGGVVDTSAKCIKNALPFRGNGHILKMHGDRGKSLGRTEAWGWGLGSPLLTKRPLWWKEKMRSTLVMTRAMYVTSVYCCRGWKSLPGGNTGDEIRATHHRASNKRLLPGLRIVIKMIIRYILTGQNFGNYLEFFLINKV